MIVLVKNFIEAAKQTFSIMINKELTSSDVEVREDPKHVYEISSMIGLSGAEIQGLLSISYPKELAKKLVMAFYKKDSLPDESALYDGIGEITNIIAGNAKKNITHFDLSLSLPNVVIGQDLFIGVTSNIPVYIVPMTCEFGTFAIEIAFNQKNEDNYESFACR